MIKANPIQADVRIRADMCAMSECNIQSTHNFQRIFLFALLKRAFVCISNKKRTLSVMTNVCILLNVDYSS